MNDKIQILKKALGSYYSNGDEHMFMCPKCDHHKRKLSVNIKKNVFKCWVCDYSGKSIATLLKRRSTELYLKWKELQSEVDIAVEYDNLFFSPKIETIEEVKLPVNFKSLSDSSTKGKEKALKYLYSRGLTFQDILKWKIGFCDYGEYKDRIIIPSFDSEGELNYFVSRTYNNFSYAKYKNPPKTKDIIFNDLMVDWRKDIVLVEGAFDALKSENCIPILGSTLKEDSLLLKKMCDYSPKIFLALDPDADSKAYKIANLLLRNDLEVYKIDVLPYNDIAEMPKEEFNKRKQNASFITERDYLLYRLGSKR